MTTDDTELLSAHPIYAAIEDGIDHLDGAGCMPWSASAIRLLDAQNDARGREIDRLAADRDRWHTAFEDLHARLLRDLPGDASELPPPGDEHWARTLDDLLTFAAETALAAEKQGD